MHNRIISKISIQAHIGLIAVFAILHFGCAKNDSDSSAEQPAPITVYNSTLSGKINGQNWTVRTGTARRVFNQDWWSITLSEDNANDPCDLRPSRNSIARFTIENKIHRTNLGVGEPRKYVSLQYFKDNANKAIAANRGFIQLTEVNSEQMSVRGTLQASFNSQNSISGEFIVKICD